MFSRWILFHCPFHTTTIAALPNPDQIWQLMARVLNDEASPAETEELNKLLQGDQDLQQKFELLRRIWEEKNHGISENPNVDVGKAMTRIMNRAAGEETVSIEMEQKKRRSLGRKRLFVPLSLVLVAAMTWLWIGKKKPSEQIPVEESIVAVKGSRMRSVLHDGTTVWLNAGSRLIYENDFKGRTREVRLEGEAFFDVVHDPGRPFIVHASGIDIEVLGTTFLVRSYPEDRHIEATLYKGSVQVKRISDKQAKPIQLKPNQKLTLEKDAAFLAEKLSEKNTPEVEAMKPASYSITHIDSTEKENERLETAWLYSRLEFRGDNFEALAKKLERWYNVTIFFRDEEVKQLRFDGSFEKETVEQAFRYLSKTIPFEYKINQDEIYIESFR